MEQQLNSGVKPPQAGRDRLVALDGLRGLAILMVVFVHYYSGLFFDSENRYLALLAKATRHFSSGVDLFFVLSSFLITRILLDNKGSKSYFSTFYLRRSLRILPLYLLILAIYFGLQLWPSTASHFTTPIPWWSYVTFTQNILFDIHHDLGVKFMAVTWSLATEEHLYLLLPCLIRICSLRTFVWVLVFASIGAILLRMFEILPAFGSFAHLPLRADTLSVGALIAVAYRADRVKQFVAAHTRQTVLLLGLFGLGMLGLTLNRFSLGCARYTWFACFYAILFCLALSGRPRFLGHLLRNKVLLFFAKISFGLYLFHELVRYVIIWSIYGFNEVKLSDGTQLQISALAFVCAVALSAALHQLIEKPAIRFGHRFSY